MLKSFFGEAIGLQVIGFLPQEWSPETPVEEEDLKTWGKYGDEEYSVSFAGKIELVAGE